MQLIDYNFDTLWVGETGWSFPRSKTLSTDMKKCTEWSDESSFKTYYNNFLQWDMKLYGIRGPDHVFYFTMRDSVANGLPEFFGLVGDGGPTKLCQNTTCKLQHNAAIAAPRELEITSHQSSADILRKIPTGPSTPETKVLQLKQPEIHLVLQ